MTQVVYLNRAAQLTVEEEGEKEARGCNGLTSGREERRIMKSLVTTHFVPFWL